MIDLRTRCIVLAIVLSSLSGCQQWFLRDADREVYDLIESRQRAALGATHPADIGTEDGHLAKNQDMYSFAPHPVKSEVPEDFAAATSPAPPLDPTTTAPAGEEDAFTAEMPGFSSDLVELPFTLAKCLFYAQEHSREYQSAKEDLYLSALALSLERFLWTPQLSSSLSLEFADFGQVRDFDRAMTATASIAAEQRLPLGGTVTAQVIDTWMRDLKVHTTSGETGVAILGADIPLLRGAGWVAYESRFQAERDLIYAVRSFERFRREFLVDIAGDFYQLLSLHTQIQSAEAQVTSLLSDFRRARALADKEQTLALEADRARNELLNARNRVAGAQENYGTALDRFKIRLGMPTIASLMLDDEDVELNDPHITEQQAIETALKYRLDLLNVADTIDDARRSVLVAKNNLLPDFNFSGSVALNTDPNKPSTVEYNTERTTWRGSLDLEVPLNRQRERNDYRSSFVDLRRAERAHDQFSDQVRAEVRRIMRQIVLARISIDIQRENIAINEFRRGLARALFETSRLESNRDVIEAENNLRESRDAVAVAVAGFRRSILDFLLATGTLRVDDNGYWVTQP